MMSGGPISTVHFEASRLLADLLFTFRPGIPHSHVARQTLSVPESFAAILVDFPILHVLDYLPFNLNSSCRLL